MPDWASLYGDSTGAKQLAQYPDARLYNAATRLSPADRPTVPVRLFSDSTDLSPYGYGSGVGGKRVIGGFTPSNKSQIMVNQDNTDYQNPDTLTALLGHEQAHVKGADEVGARQKEIQILSQLGPNYAKLIGNIKKTYGIK